MDLKNSKVTLTSINTGQEEIFGEIKNKKIGHLSLFL